jgi:hypothetical protein
MKLYDKRTRSWRRHTTYTIWYNIVARCTNESHKAYDDYGGRGIQVQEDWVPGPGRPNAIAFRNFMRDVGLRPSQALSLDRKDPNGHYTRDNTRWATDLEQARNKRSTLYIDDPDDPSNRLTVAELAQRKGLRYQTLRYQLKLQGKWPGD